MNNAGVSVMERQVTEDGFEFMMGVNHLGKYSIPNCLNSTGLTSSQHQGVAPSSDTLTPLVEKTTSLADQTPAYTITL